MIICVLHVDIDTHGSHLFQLRRELRKHSCVFIRHWCLRRVNSSEVCSAYASHVIRFCLHTPVPIFKPISLSRTICLSIVHAKGTCALNQFPSWCQDVDGEVNEGLRDFQAKALKQSGISSCTHPVCPRKLLGVSRMTRPVSHGYTKYTILKYWFDWLGIAWIRNRSELWWLQGLMTDDVYVWMFCRHLVFRIPKKHEHTPLHSILVLPDAWKK